MSLYTLFLLENVLLAAHQGKTARRDYKEILKNIRMIWRHWFHCFFSIVHSVLLHCRVLARCKVAAAADEKKKRKEGWTVECG